jgi:hypothetical protein
MVSGMPAAADEADARVVAIGDIHGEYEGLVSILRETGLIDEQNQWTGGSAILVQTGDMVDRGPGVRKVLDLLMDLEQQAPSHGGKVRVLMGNHESMNLLGDFQDVTPEIYASFAAENSDKLRQAAWKEWVNWMGNLARSRGRVAPQFGKDKKAQWMAEHPPGYLEYLEAVSADGQYGRWLASLPLIAQIGDTIYMHAGIGPEYADKTVAEIDELHRQEIATFTETRRKLVAAGVVPSSFNLFEINSALLFQVANPPVEAFANRKTERLIEKAVAGLDRLQAILLEDSPLWYRGYTNLAEEELLTLLAQLEESHGAHRFVVAHSPMATGSIHHRLGGRIFLIDTGMLTSYYKGRPSALERADGRFTAIYMNERQVLVEGEEESFVPASATSSNLSRISGRTTSPARYSPAAASGVTTASLASPQEESGGSKTPERVWLDAEGKPLPFQTHAEAQEFLRSAQVTSQENVPVGVTKPKKLLLEKDGLKVHAKFGYVDRTGQHEKLTDGSVEMYFIDSYRSDMAAYELGLELGMDNIPPAVMREVNGEKGIVQLWIQGLTSYEDWMNEGNSGQPSSLYLQRQVKDMRTFDLLIRNTDRNRGNIMWDSSYHLWLIDHTRSLARDPNLRKADEFKGCSRKLFQAIQDLKEKAVAERLSPYLGNFEIKALFKRRSKLLKLVNDAIKKKGEDEILFEYGAPPKGMVITYDETAASELSPSAPAARRAG